MSGWGWIVGGAVLLGAELAFGVNAQFYLVLLAVPPFWLAWSQS